MANYVNSHLMPLHFNGLNHGFWLDNRGNEQYFFDGSNTKENQCQCSKNGQKCLFSSEAKCNCDLRFPIFTEDFGKIDAFWLLPITGFGYNFHGLKTLNYQNSSAKLIVGDLICKDKFEIKIEGKISDLEHEVEKFSMDRMDHHFDLGFDLKIQENWITNQCFKIFEIQRMDYQPMKLFAKIEFCPGSKTIGQVSH